MLPQIGLWPEYIPSTRRTCFRAGVHRQRRVKTGRVLASGLFPAALLILTSTAFGTVTLRQEQDVPPVPTSPAETYRLRIENAPYGRIEISTDMGEHYVLIGRVIHPATAPASEKTALKASVVVRNTPEDLIFSIAPGKALHLHAQPPRGNFKKDRKHPVVAASSPPGPAVLATNLSPHQGLFDGLLPPPGSPARIQFGPRDLSEFPEGYTPGSDDVFVFPVTLPTPRAAGPVSASAAPPAADSKETVRKRIQALGQAYAADAPERARKEKRMVVSGTLTLRARLPSGEPDPIAAVIYAVDGDMVAVQNTGPFTYPLDTRRFPNGEHVVEIRALTARNGLISRARALIVVQNGGTSG